VSRGPLFARTAFWSRKQRLQYLLQNGVRSVLCATCNSPNSWLQVAFALSFNGGRQEEVKTSVGTSLVTYHFNIALSVARKALAHLPLLLSCVFSSACCCSAHPRSGRALPAGGCGRAADTLLRHRRQSK
jgi:hypothetical protein